MLFSCDAPAPVETGNDESLMTEYSEHLSVIMTKNGRRSYIFKAPLVEGYTLAKEPYREFRKGVEITTYQDDSLTTVDAVLTANYAIYYENRELWEAKGDVVVVKSDGKTLYTQQLFWNAKTKRIYSNVDTKIVQNDSRNVFQGEGFESDEEFKEWRFRRFTGKMDVDVSQTDEEEPADSLKTASPASGQPQATAPVRAVEKTSQPEREKLPSNTRPAASESGAPAEATSAAVVPEQESDSAAGTSSAKVDRTNPVNTTVNGKNDTPAADAMTPELPADASTPAAAPASVPKATHDN